MNLQTLTNLYKPLSYLTIALFLFQSCTQEKPLNPNSSEMDLATQTQLMGESVAQILTEPATRTWLRAKFTKTENLTGYPEILFSSILEAKVQNELTFEKLLSKSISSRANLTLLESEGMIREYLQNVPNFHLTLPEQFSKWNADEVIPEVAVENYSGEYPDEKMMAYDYLGKAKKIPYYTETPKEVTLVIGFNERTDENGEFIPRNTFIPNPEISLPSNPTLRGTGEEFKLRIIYSDQSFSHMKEGWFDNTAEIKFFFGAPAYGGSPVGTIYTDMKKSTINNHEWHCVLNANSPFDWHASTFGDAIIVKVIEVDNKGSKVTTTLGYKDDSGTTLSTAFEYTEGDEDLGYMTVHRNDPNWRMYGNGQMRFYLTDPDVTPNCD